MMSQNQCATAPKPTTPIDQAFNALGHEVESLGLTVGNLQDRLTPVLASVPESKLGNQACVAKDANAGNSPMICQLERLKEMVFQIRATVQKINDRVEV